MKLHGRRGIEIASGTIVMLIVSIVVLGLALTLTYNVFCQAEVMAEQISTQNRDQINRLLTTGGRVVIPNNNQEARVQGSFICGSSRSQPVEFVVGIQNRQQTTQALTVTLEYEGTTANPPPSLFPDSHLIAIFDTAANDAQVISQLITLEAGETFMGTFIVNLPLDTPPGQYTYTLVVTYSGGRYGAQTAHVTVR